MSLGAEARGQERPKLTIRLIRTELGERWAANVTQNHFAARPVCTKSLSYLLCSQHVCYFHRRVGHDSTGEWSLWLKINLSTPLRGTTWVHTRPTCSWKDNKTVFASDYTLLCCNQPTGPAQEARAFLGSVVQQRALPMR